MRFFPSFDNFLDLLHFFRVGRGVRIGGEQLEKAVGGVFVQVLAQAVLLLVELGLELARVTAGDQLKCGDLNHVFLHQGFDQGVNIAVLPGLFSGQLNDLCAGQGFADAP